MALIFSAAGTIIVSETDIALLSVPGDGFAAIAVFVSFFGKGMHGFDVQEPPAGGKVPAEEGRLRAGRLAHHWIQEEIARFFAGFP